MYIYLAGPLFCDAERAFNAQLAEKLEGRGYSVFLPQRDGVESWTLVEEKLTGDALRRKFFAVDRNEILKADVFLFILDGRVPDEGACVELGIAYTQKLIEGRDKLIIGLLTDRRSAFPEAQLNAMIEGALDSVSKNTADLISGLEAYHKMKSVEEP